MDRTSRPEQAATKDGEIAERLREAVRRNPRKMTLQLAREHGVPEVEIIRAFPPERALELDITQWENILRSFEALGPVRVLVSNGASTVEVVGQFGGFSTTGEFFNVQTDSLDMHIRWQELAAAFAIEKPGHMDGLATYSIQLFDRVGAAAFKVFVNFGEPLAPERQRLFCRLRDSFRASGGHNSGR